MKNERDQLNEALENTISRRSMLKRLCGGFATAALLPTINSAAQKRTTLKSAAETVEPIWKYDTPAGTTVYSTTFYNGTIVITANTGIYSLDIHTKTVRWSHSLGGDLKNPLVINDVVYVVSDGGSQKYLYAIDIPTGDILWQEGYAVESDIVFTGENIIFTTTNGLILALDLQGNQVWSYSTGRSSLSATKAVFSNGVVMVRTDSAVYGLDLKTGTLRWRYAVISNGVYDNAQQLSIGQGNVYFILNIVGSNTTNYLYAVDVNTGQLKWRQTFSEPLSPPTYNSGVVYVGDWLGRFYAVNAHTGGTPLWHTAVQGAIGYEYGSIFIEDGIAYFNTNYPIGGQIPKVYAVDLPSKGAVMISYNLVDDNNTAYPYTFITAVDTGVVYFAAGPGAEVFNHLYALRLGEIVHEFFAESELMVEDYKNVNGKAQGDTSSFRTHVQLFDPNKNPRAEKSVKVWASAPITIKANGKTYQIDPQNSVWLKTDGVGELSIVSIADSISSPALYLWSNFMELSETIVIYPDHDTLLKLSGIQAEDFSTAKTYDGTPLLPASFPAAQISSLAAAIRNTVGGVNPSALTQQVRLSRRRRLGLNTVNPYTYIAYPESTTNMIYQSVAASADRAYKSGETVSWTTTIDSSGNISFQPSVSLSLQVYLRRRIKATFGSIIDDAEKFARNVVHGARKAAKVAWNWAKDSITTIIDDAGNVYHLAINSLEKAALVAAGILKTVVGDIKKAVEWLSHLFDWNAILATKDQLRGIVNTNLNTVKTSVDNLITNDMAAIHSFFTSVEATVPTTLNLGKTVIGTTTLKSQQYKGNDPQSLYGMNGAKSYVKSRWLMTKFQENVGKATTGSAALAMTASSDPILGPVEDFFNFVESNLSKLQFQSLPADVKNTFTELAQELTTDPSALVTKSFSSIITLISDIAVILLKFSDAVIEGFLGLLKEIFDELVNSLTQTIDMPVISDLYALITNGSTLTILDLCCLMTAVPTTIIQKTFSSPQPPPSNAAALSAPPTLEFYGYVFSAAFYTVLDVIIDIYPNGTPTPAKIAHVAFDVMTELFDIPELVEDSEPIDKLFYILGFAPPVMDIIDIRVSSSPDEDFKENWEKAAAITLSFYGTLMLILVILLKAPEIAKETSADEKKKSILSLIQTIFGKLPYALNFIGAIGEDGDKPKVAYGVIGGVCDLTVIGLQIAQWEIED
jgi:outer membrane protein assembly factor BamB